MADKRWYSNTGKDGDVVLSTRIRLARNLADYPFPHRLDTAGKEKVGRGSETPLADACAASQFIEMKDLPKPTR